LKKSQIWATPFVEVSAIQVKMAVPRDITDSTSHQFLAHKIFVKMLSLTRAGACMYIVPENLIKDSAFNPSIS